MKNNLSPTRPVVAPWRLKTQAVLILVVGVAGLAAGLLGVYFQYEYSSLESAYRQAGDCGTALTAATSQRCTFTGPATVSGSHRVVRLYVDVTFAAMPGQSFTTSFSTQREPPADTIRDGASGTAQLWDGKVTKFAGVGTVDDPDYLPTNMLGAALIFAAAGLGVSIWAIFLVRRAWKS